MKRPIPTVIVFGLLALVPALSAAAEAPLRLDIDDSGRLALLEVVQTPTKPGFLVEGIVAKRGMERGHIHGDVDVELLNQDGEIIAMREGKLVRIGGGAKNPDHAHFSVEFISRPPDARAIRVRYHRR